MKHILSIIALGAATCGLFAQPVPGTEATTNAYADWREPFGAHRHFWEINTQAWEDTKIFSWETVGVGLPFRIYPVVGFESELNWRGKKLAPQTMLAKIGTETYLFGGQAYLDLASALPLDGDYAKSYDIYMGWCYQLTKYVDIDIGGNIIFYDKNVIGPGQTSPIGSKDTSDMHIGLSANIPLNPWAWVTYDFVHDQLIVETGLRHREPLVHWIGTQDLYLELSLTAGWLKANRYSGRGQINGQYWRNSYCYVMATAGLAYEPVKDLTIRAGVRWSANNDGNGVAPNGLLLGPDNSVWGGVSVTYAFDL